MLLAIAALQLVLIAIVLLRRPAGGSADSRLSAVPDALVALEAKVATKLEAIDSALRSNVSELRYEQSKTAQENRAAADTQHRELRAEVQGSIDRLAATLNGGLTAFRADNTAAADKLRDGVLRDLAAMREHLQAFFAEAGKRERDAGAALQASLRDLTGRQTTAADQLRETLQRSFSDIRQEQRDAGEKLRGTVEAGLIRLSAENTDKLEQMRITVDEKLETTLNDRLTKSFGQVTTHLGEVQKGLGEMKELASGVSDLKKVFSNVKSRGIVGEFQLGMQLEQMFSRDQYEVNVPIKAGSGERVEFALKIPDGDRDHILLPIDAKFPREDWERLEYAYEHGTLEEQAKAGAAFERAIRTEGKRICEKYIDPPNTLPFGIMFLPTEALYAEVMRRPGLHTELQAQCNVTVAGPSSFMAILTSFQMGFRTLAIQKKGNEVWKVLGTVKSEFNKFELLMNKVERNVSTVQNTLNEIGTRTRVINKRLHDVSELPSGAAAPTSGVLAFDGVAPLLAAAAEEE